MELNTHNAEILLSAANKSHYPQDELPEIALAGRSNEMCIRDRLGEGYADSN